MKATQNVANRGLSGLSQQLIVKQPAGWLKIQPFWKGGNNGGFGDDSFPLPIPTVTSFPLLLSERRGKRSSDKQLDPLTDRLPADRAGLQCGAAVDAGGVPALEDQLDVVVDADGTGHPLLHLPVARLQLFEQVVLLRVLGAGAAVHLRLVCGGRPSLLDKFILCRLCRVVQDETVLLC